MSTENVREFTKGDTLKSLYAQLLNADGTPVGDITGQTITFIMVDVVTGRMKVNAAAVIVIAATAHVRYDWDPADVDTVGEYWGWFVRTSGGRKEHHPVGNLLRIPIVKAEVA